MAQNYLEKKCKGKYRLKTPIDPETNNFYREKIWNEEKKEYEWGEYIHTEVYIKCLYGMIYHVGGNVLEAYITGRPRKPASAKTLYNKLIRKYSDIILPDMRIESDIPENMYNETMAKGGCLRFKYKDLDTIAKLMGAYKLGANLSPFSVKNLEQDEYEIPEIDLNMFKRLKLEMGETNKFYNGYVAEKGLTSKEFTQKRKFEKLKQKEYIHKFYDWEEFIDYCKENKG